MKMLRQILAGTAIALLVAVNTLYAQNTTTVAAHQEDILTERLFETAQADRTILKSYVSSATFLTLDQQKLLKVVNDDAAVLRLEFPLNDGTIWTLELAQKQILTDEFYADNQDGAIIDYDRGLHYQGHIVGDPTSLAAISLFDNKVYGIIATEGKTYVLGHLKQNVFPAGRAYILYKESDMLIKNNSKCAADQLPDVSKFELPEAPVEKSAECKIVKMYFEADNKMYRDNGSSEQETIDFVAAMFNVVALLYENDGIYVRISKVRVWTTPDGYPTSTSTAALYAFRSRLGSSFDGDLAQLLSTVNSNNGGVAFVGVLCTPSYAVSYSNIRNNFSEFPTYSWTVEVVTHEFGHNLGSPHTQSCSWPGGAIDGCYSSEGSCPRGPTPTNGGTIMSYCHLTNVGINFQKGFGPLPRNLIQSKVSVASCLETIEGDCSNDGGDGGGGGGGGGGGFGTPNLTRSANSLSAAGLIANISVILKNRGDGSSNACKVGFFLSLDNSFSTSDYLVGYEEVPTMRSGESYGLTAVYDFSTLEDIAPGNYYLGYIIDYEDVVAESDESDNDWYWINPRFLINNNGGGGGGDDGDDNGGGGNGSDYCSSSGKDVKYEWIANVQIGDIDNATERDNGYGDYTNLETTLERGSTPTIRLQPGYRSQQYEEMWRVWIDFNKDKDFDDAGELVFQSDAPTRMEEIGRLNIPGDAEEGKTRMRVSMKWYDEDKTSQLSCSTFGYGEVEDYTVEIVGEVTAYCAINNVTLGEQTACDPLTTSYNQDLRISYSGNPTTIEATAQGKSYRFEATGSPQHILLDTLPANGQMANLVLKLVADNGCSVEETYNNFFTAAEACEVTCEIPLPLGIEDIQADIVEITWEEQRFAEYYQVRYRGAGDADWEYQTAAEATTRLESLLNNTTYEYQIRANCGNVGWSDWSEVYVFVTKGNCKTVTPRSVEIESATSVQINWYPIPGASQYRIRYRLFGTTDWEMMNLESTSITLEDLEGNRIYQYQIAAQCGVSWSGWSAIYAFIVAGNGLTNDISSRSWDENAAPLELSLAPNPVQDWLTIAVNRKSESLVRLMDLRGKLVKQVIIYGVKNEIYLGDLRSGVYFLQVQSSDGNSSTQRIVKY